MNCSDWESVVEIDSLILSVVTVTHDSLLFLWFFSLSAWPKCIYFRIHLQRSHLAENSWSLGWIKAWRFRWLIAERLLVFNYVYVI